MKTHPLTRPFLVLAVLLQLTFLVAPLERQDSSALAAPQIAWQAVENLDEARANHTTTLLHNGRVLAAGGDQGDTIFLASTEIFNPNTNNWIDGPDMHYARRGHTATMLADGRVLVVGGYGILHGDPGSPTYLATAEIYDPVSNSWSLTTGSLASGRVYHTATLLHDGRVLVAGGQVSDISMTSSLALFDPATGLFTSLSATLPTARRDHTATLLLDGKVFFVGGYGGGTTYYNTTCLFDIATDVCTAKTAITESRSRASAVLLRNGKVLVAGGRSYTATPSPTTLYRNSVYLYDPALNSWSELADLSYSRAEHAAALLPDGKVMLVGGRNAGLVNYPDIYDPAVDAWTPFLTVFTAYRLTAVLLTSGNLLVAGGIDATTGYLTQAGLFSFGQASFTSTGRLIEGRKYFTANLLPDGKVLAVGGRFTSSSLQYDSTELYNPATRTWNSGASFSPARDHHTATLLADGRLLVVGGYSYDSTPPHLDKVELYDYATNTWSPGASLNHRRTHHTATLLANGRVLVAGGYYSDSGIIQLAHCEIYDPHTNQWTVTGSLNFARDSHVAVLLPDGKVLVAGGYGGNNSAELYDPVSGVWSLVTSAMVHERVYHAAVLLPNGKVLIAGGYDRNAELFNPGVNTFTEVADAMADVRAGLTLTLLPNGQVLAAGGYNGSTYVDHGEVFNPATGLWDEPVTMNDPHESHAAVALADSSVLVIGGDGNTDPDTYDHYVMTELFNPGLGFQEAWRPQISSLSSPVHFGDAPWLQGSGFLGGGEASAGHTQSASSGYPLVQIYRLDNSQISYLWADPQENFSDTAFYGKLPAGFPMGPVMMFVYANGIPSVGKVTFLLGHQLFLPLIKR